MKNIAIYDPFASRLNKAFSHLFWNHPALLGDQDSFAGLQLKLDVSEDDKNYLVRADLPGINKEDIRVSIDGNQITISAESKSSKEEKKDKNLIYSERYEGKVYSTFSLDNNVDESRAEAKYAKGVLELTLPKKSNGGNGRLLTIQ